ncbi:hypothetical protein HL658_25575 [Azospirillum sp. RWY-5-1]|uniref:RNA polymerase sigma factor 70 region 1.1 domain-containing protein n=1 Tax=Azospirillum oleiclasticum TaxID=2735135 RepID=A0ABX2TH65_9PROT|nr:RNA polymerase sigma factor region1.1 domain-containing protein [Azospirillum oleiclasticum]NYZ15925.1 hypothetical protein [Azospirillum oleiclasticum]NYZ23596.1 hypothetical protein [Azospirillum oleiclasticum]
MASHDAAVQRLIEQGRRTGRLTTDDLSRALPIQSMDPAEIAAVVDRLDAAGIDVDVDERLTGGRPRPQRGAAGSPAPTLPPTIPPVAAPAVSEPGVRPSREGWVGTHGDAPAHGSRRAPSWEADGVNIMPVVAFGISALVLMIALG